MVYSKAVARIWFQDGFLKLLVNQDVNFVPDFL
jgi:hypothetical protein